MCLRQWNQVSFRGNSDSDPLISERLVANDHFGPRPDDHREMTRTISLIQLGIVGDLKLKGLAGRNR